MIRVLKVVLTASSIFMLTGCASTLISSSIMSNGKHDSTPEVNEAALNAIQSLRAMQPSAQQAYKFSYTYDSESLSPIERYKLALLVNNSAQKVIVNIAPAKAPTPWQQLILTNKRVEALKNMVKKEKGKVVIIYQPNLLVDTVNVLVGA